MRNITLALPDEVYLKARILAAERDQSLSAMVAGMLSTATGCSTESNPAAGNLFGKNRFGMPLLKKRGAVITNELINKIREEEGI